MTRRVVQIFAAMAVQACGGQGAEVAYLQPPVALRYSTSFEGLTPAAMVPVSSEKRPAALASPIALTASDGTGLELVSLKVRGAIAGPVALTDVELVFQNPRDQQIEGRFEIELPPAAAVSHLAMKIGDEWQTGEIVDRNAGQQAFEGEIRRSIDPLLFEHGAGNRFSARVFPIAPHEYKHIQIGYSEILAKRSAEYRFPLRGLPEVRSLDVSVLVDGRRVRTGGFDIRPKDDFRASLAKGAVGVAAGKHAVIRFPVGGEGGTDPLGDLLVLFDSSASQAEGFESRVRALERLAAELCRRHPGLPMSVAAFDHRVEAIHDGRACDFGGAEGRKILSRRALGASNLHAALSWAASRRPAPRRILIVGDLVPSLGPSTQKELATVREHLGERTRIDLLASGGTGGNLADLLLEHGKRPGAILSEDGTPRAWADALERAGQEVNLSVPGAKWVWPRAIRSTSADSDVVMVVDLDRAPASGIIKVRVERGAREGTPRAETLSIPVVPGPAPLVERTRAWAKLAELEEQAETPELRKQMVELSMRYRVLSRVTALLVMEDDAAYTRYGLDRDRLAPRVRVSPTGVEVTGGRDEPAKAAAVTRPGRGSIAGRVVSKETGEPLAGVAAVALRRQRGPPFSALTDDDGRYRIPDLAPGRYTVNFYYLEGTVSESARVRADRTTRVAVEMDPEEDGGQVITLAREGGTETTMGTTVGSTSALENRYIPSSSVPGRSFEHTLGAVPSASAQTARFTAVIAESRSWTKVRAEPRRARVVARDGERYGSVRALRVRGDHQQALTRALEWTAEEPGSVLAYLALADSLEALGEAGLAARAITSIVDLAPTLTERRRIAASYLLRLGTPGARIADLVLREGWSQRPDQLIGLRMLAFARARAGDYRAALVALGEYLSADRDDGSRAVVQSDCALLAAAWRRAEPGAAAEVEEILYGLGLGAEVIPSLTVLASWESESANIGLTLVGKDDSILYRVSGSGGEWRAHHVGATQLAVRLERNSTGERPIVFGRVLFVHHDGRGVLRFSDRPFISVAAESIDLGTLDVPSDLRSAD